MKNKFYYLCFFVPTLYTETLYAKPFRNHFLTQISASSQHSDNAAKEYTNEDGVSEIQDEYQFSLDGAYKKQWFSTTATYAFSDRQFSEASQPNERLITGKGQLDLGDSYHPFHLIISQSSDSILNAPDAIDISSNRIDRTLLTIEPSSRWHINDMDIIGISLRRSKINYDKEDEFDSLEKSANIYWEKSLSEVDQLLLNLESESISFEIDPTLDYKLRNIVATYDVDLRHLNYHIAFGKSQADQNDKNTEFSVSTFDIRVTIGNTFNKLSVGSSQEINNSTLTTEFPSFSSISFGDNNKALGIGLDLIKSRSTNAQWSSNALCGQCNLYLSIARINDNYFSLNEDSVSKNKSALFSYAKSRNSTITLGYDFIDRRFDAGSVSESVSIHSYQLTYIYQFISGFSLKAFVTKIERDGNSEFSATENIVGIKLSYKI